ncbi:MAG TPA: choice-of-anchor tandem repeat GloVer-containing protein [Rhizomicrobium sp.]
MHRIFHIPNECVLAGTLALAMLAHLSAAQATTFKVLHSFTGGSDGGNPGYGSLIMDTNGNLYGATALGGTRGAGTVYELAPDGTETVLHAFAEGSGGDGPQALVMDSKGNLYGTACCGGAGDGIVFKIAPGGREKIIHTFVGMPNDGATPESALVRDKSGNFYGTTTGGGTFGDGAVFKIAADGTESLLYSFAGGHDGDNPFAGLIMDKEGNLYGTTGQGGRKVSAGTVFKLAPDGTKTVLYSFKGSPNDGSGPDGTLIFDTAGNLYGTTLGGGRSGCYSGDGCGTVFKLETNGTETVLHLFKGARKDGANLVAGMIADSAGNLYGTTEFGRGLNGCNGSFGCGTVFELAPDGAETILHSFRNGSEGANPVAGLVADGAGNLYGTTAEGGAYGYGTVFEITP